MGGRKRTTAATVSKSESGWAAAETKKGGWLVRGRWAWSEAYLRLLRLKEKKKKDEKTKMKIACYKK